MGALPLAAVLRRVAGPRLDPHRQAHLLDRPGQIARDVGGQRLERRDVERVQAPGGPGLVQLDQARQEPAQRLAAAGGRDQQRVAALAREVEHLRLMAAQLPAAGGEPITKDRRQWRLAHSPGRQLPGACVGRGFRGIDHGCTAIYGPPRQRTPFAAQAKRPKDRAALLPHQSGTSCRTTATSSPRARRGPFRRP